MSERTGSTNTSSGAHPQPVLRLTPEKPAYPAAGGVLDCLLELSVALPEAEVDRHPIDLALVIDRSGSMSGEPLAAANAAAREAVRMLLPGDRVAVIAFDDAVYVPMPLSGVAGGTSHIDAAIDAIASGGSTNLFGGWAEGMSQVIGAVSPDRVTRVALLSDGHANHGVTDRGRIAADVAEAARLGVSTSVFGFGRHYDEALLRGVADAGGGNYLFIEDVSQTVEAFQQELASVSALRGRNLRLSVEGHGVRIGLPGAEAPHGAAASSVALPPLIGGLPFDRLVTLEFQPRASLAAVVLSWDDVLSGAREELRVPLALEAASATVFATLPRDERVLAMRRALDIAKLKRDAAAAAERNDAPKARMLVRQIASEAAAMPAGVTRDEEVAEVERLERYMDDMQMLSKRAHYAMHNRMASSAPEKMEALRQREMELLAARKLRFAEEARQAAEQASQQATREAVAGNRPRSAAASAQPIVLQTRVVTAADGREVSVQVVKGDIASESADAIVNSTNRAMFGRGGVDGAIHKRGGRDLTAAVRSVGRLEYGTAVFTPGFDLSARYVIHVAAPRFNHSGDIEALARCYRAAFDLADRLGATSVAVPLIGAGFNGAPAEVAASVQEAEIAAWLARSYGPCRLVRCVGLDQRLRMLTLGTESAAATPAMHN